MEEKQNDRKELRTSFDMVTFATAIETLKKGEETIASLAERYEEGDKRRETLNGLSSTFASSYDKLAEVIGSDFVECAINVIRQR